MPEFNKRVAVLGLKEVARSFARYVKFRRSAERNTAGLLRSIRALKADAERAAREAKKP